MATVNISGLPLSIRLPKLVIVFRSIFKQHGVIKFWIKEMEEVRGTDSKSAKIEFDSLDEAYTASSILNGFEYNDGQYVYILTARVENEQRGRPRRRSPSPFNYQSRHREYDDEPHYYSMERSRSPIRRESSKLDLEIELLRKQRMIIEEERRILLERKKLELVKEFGPSALKEFKSLEDHRGRDRDRERRYRDDRADYRPRRRSPPPPPRTRPMPRQRPPKRQSVLPQFLLPCKLILAELKETMDSQCDPKERALLTKLMRATIRKRLAVALEGKPILPGSKIVTLYRVKYPPHQDEDFVKKHLNDVRASHMLSKGDDDDKKTATVSEDEKMETEKEEIENEEETKNQETDNNESETVDTGAANPDAECVNSDPEEKITDETVTEAKEEPNAAADAPDEAIESEEQAAPQAEQTECSRSVGSCEGITLLDKNDEDWAEGENDFDLSDTDAQVAPE